MFQCLGLGTVETGGCGEDWWHPECIVGLPRDWHKAEKKEGDDNEDEESPLPQGFPAEDDFETFLCYKCIDSNPWLKRYAGTAGFLPPIYHKGDQSKVPENGESSKEDTANAPQEDEGNSKKRKLEDDEDQPAAKKPKADETTPTDPEPKSEPESKPKQPQQQPTNKHDTLPKTTSTGTFSLFLKEDFRDHLCRCPECYPHLSTHRQLREEEETYEPPLSEAGDEEPNGGGSTGTGSLLDRGEAAFSNMDRVRAIEGAMVYNHLRDKVKEFLTPFAESGTAVGAEDIKEYFAKLRGDPAAAANDDGESNGNEDGNRREQSGTF